MSSFPVSAQPQSTSEEGRGSTSASSRGGRDLRAQELRALGMSNTDRAISMMNDLPGPQELWAQSAGSSADPDLCLLQLTRLHEVAPDLVATLAQVPQRVERLAAVFGGSRHLGDYIIAAAQRVRWIWEHPQSVREHLLEAVGAHICPTRTDTEANAQGFGAEDLGEPSTVLCAASGRSADDLRRAYREVLLGIVADDLTSSDPVEYMPVVGRRMSELVDATLEAALALARRDIDPCGTASLAIIAMGKTGAEELNYISDVDVIYVTHGDEEAVATATRLASFTAQMCSGPGEEEPLWTIDAALRPEGKDGALVRTLDSYRQYWQKWAQTWEFQALMKARCVAGDHQLGEEFERAAAAFVWSAAGKEGFVETARSMRVRVEQSVPRKDAERELKLGRGGLRDVEFSVQLLQLVHGRYDDSLHQRNTLEATAALSAGGYVARTHAAELQQCYAFLRAVEHRAQLPRMRRTHLLPLHSTQLRALWRSFGARFTSTEDFLAELSHVRSRVRVLHEDMFYRPIVAATAQLSTDHASIVAADASGLNEAGACARLAAIGYVDTRGAFGHIRALTSGTSRRAAIQRHLLPVVISWLADGPDPDMGLLNFRTLSDQIGDSHWYLALLRDSRVAAQRLCALLSTSRWIAQSLGMRPEAVQWLDDDSMLAPFAQERLAAEMSSLVQRHIDAESAALRIRAVRNRELTRAAMADAVDHVLPVRSEIAAATDQVLTATLEIVMREEAQQNGTLVDLALIAMGRYGGEESSFASDADVMAVHAPAPGVSDSEAVEAATRMVNRMRVLLGSTSSHVGVTLDLDLRPEGRNGPMTKTPQAYAEYYARWALAWERQALLRARPAAGNPALLVQTMREIDAVRYGHALSAQALTDIRLLKARMERERLPRGVESVRHVKLGPGGLTDVEWVVQLLQLQYAGECESLRTPSTLLALEALEREGLLNAEQALDLRTAWELAARIRSGNVLISGRMSGVKLDVLSRDSRDLIPLARLMGYVRGEESQLEQDWLRAGRRARVVMEEVFYGHGVSFSIP